MVSLSLRTKGAASGVAASYLAQEIEADFQMFPAGFPLAAVQRTAEALYDA
jgi:hypothetical protein